MYGCEWRCGRGRSCGKSCRNYCGKWVWHIDVGKGLGKVLMEWTLILRKVFIKDRVENLACNKLFENLWVLQ